MRKSLAVLLLLFSSQALAEPITYNFTGTVTSAQGVFLNQGSAVTGTFTFDDRLAGSSASTPYVVSFWSSFTRPFSASVSVGAVTASLTATDNSHLEIQDGRHINPVDESIIHDTVSVLIAPYMSSEGLSLIGSDYSDTAVAAGSGNLSNTIAAAIDILDDLDVGLFRDDLYGNDLSYGRWAHVAEGGVVSSVEFVWTGLSRSVQDPEPTRVPEPMTFPLLAFGLLGLFVAARNRRA